VGLHGLAATLGLNPMDLYGPRLGLRTISVGLSVGIGILCLWIIVKTSVGWVLKFYMGICWFSEHIYMTARFYFLINPNPPPTFY
jgi:hypothetical protein